MRTLTKEPPHHPTGLETDPKQDIPTEQQCKSHNPLLLQRREHWYGGEKNKTRKTT